MQSPSPHPSLKRGRGSPQAFVGCDLDLLDRRGAKRLASDALAGDLERLQFLSQPEAAPEPATSLGSVDPMCCSSAEASPSMHGSFNSTPQGQGAVSGAVSPRSWMYSTALKSRLGGVLSRLAEAQPTSPTDPSLDADDSNDLRKATLRRMLMLRAGEADLLPEPQQLPFQQHQPPQQQQQQQHGRHDRSLRRSSRMARPAAEAPACQPSAAYGEGRDSAMCISPIPAAQLEGLR